MQLEFTERSQYREYNEGVTNWADDIQKDVTREVWMIVPPFFQFQTFMIIMEVYLKRDLYEESLIYMVSNPMTVSTDYDLDISTVNVSYNDTVT